MSKEAKSRIKINKLLEEAGWRFFDDEKGSANIVLENNAKLTKVETDEFGEDFEKTTNGFIDYLLLDNKGFPFIVLEAKKEEINPLFAKEQARKYAQSQNCRFIISICPIFELSKIKNVNFQIFKFCNFQISSFTIPIVHFPNLKFQIFKFASFRNSKF